MHCSSKYSCEILTIKLCFIVCVVVCYLPTFTLESKVTNRRETKSILSILRDTSRTMTINTQQFRFRPFITCWNCSNFLTCFRTCPFKEYPGLDQ